MSAVGTFLALSRDERWLLLRAAGAVLFVRVAFAFWSTARLRAWAQQGRRGRLGIDRIAWAVSAASRRLPGATCLVSGLALQRLLSREGHASELHIGVAKLGERLAAHAWVVCEGRTLIGEVESGDYTRLVAWRAAGPSGGPPPSA